MRIWPATIVGSVLLMGCGTGVEPESTPTETVTVTVEPSQIVASEQPVATLRETCPLIEQQLPGIAAPARRWGTYASALRELAAVGDAETQNAIDVLLEPVETMAGDPRGMDYFDANDALLSGLDVVADRCRSVGSSALQ